MRQREYSRAGRIAAVVKHVCQSADYKPHLVPLRMQQREDQRDRIHAQLGQLCSEAKLALENHDLQNFEIRFRQIHEFESGLFAVFPNTLQPTCTALHQSVCTWLEQHVSDLDKTIEASNICAIAESVKLLRRAGQILVTTFALYLKLAEANQRHRNAGPWLGRLTEVIHRRFVGDQALEIGVHYALLDLDPNAATREDVAKQFRVMSKRYHPDKGGSTAMQQLVMAAKQELEQDSARERFKAILMQPFACEIIAVPNNIRRRVYTLLEERRYSSVGDALGELPALPKLVELGNLTTTELQQSSDEVHRIIKEHMRSLKQRINGLNSCRDYKTMNTELDLYDVAVAEFSRYDEIYNDAYRLSGEIQQRVETEIEQLAFKARLYIQGKSEQMAELRMKDFALQLIYLGRILDNLPRFKDFCRQKLAGVLDTCREQGGWGYCFVFKLGILLGQGKVGDQDKDGKVCDSPHAILCDH